MTYIRENLITIGLLGGMSPQSTKEYYSLINEGVNRIKGNHHVAELLLCSVNFNNIERFVRHKQWEDAAEYLVEKAKCLENGGAKYIFLCTNTMHKVRDSIKSAISIPFIDIFEITAEEIIKKGVNTVGLLGTYPTMSDPFYLETYNEHNINVITPSEKEKIEMDRIIFEEMCHNKFSPESKDYYLQVVKNLKEKGAQGIILGCTEIKMLINQDDFDDLLIFDTTELHCNKAIELCIKDC